MQLRRHLVWVCCGICFLVNVGCTSQPEGLRVTPRGTQQMTNPTFGEPIVLEQSHYVLIPFWLHAPDRMGKMGFFSGSEGFSSYSYSGKMSGDVSLRKAFAGYLGLSSTHWNNLVFYDKRSGENHLLLDHKAVICSAYVPSSA